MNEQSTQENRSCGPMKRKTSGEILTQSAVAYIEAHYKEKFSLQTMACELYVNGSYLLRVFKKYTGFTPLAYHHHVRCQQAKELLSLANGKNLRLGCAPMFSERWKAARRLNTG